MTVTGTILEFRRKKADDGCKGSEHAFFPSYTCDCGKYRLTGKWDGSRLVAELVKP